MKVSSFWKWAEEAGRRWVRGVKRVDINHTLAFNMDRAYRSLPLTAERIHLRTTLTIPCTWPILPSMYQNVLRESGWREAETRISIENPEIGFIGLPTVRRVNQPCGHWVALEPGVLHNTFSSTWRIRIPPRNFHPPSNVQMLSCSWTRVET